MKESYMLMKEYILLQQMQMICIGLAYDEQEKKSGQPVCTGNEFFSR